MWGRRRSTDAEIAPEDILLDSLNTPSFDRSRFEGRIERPLARSTFVFLGSILCMLFIVVLVQTWNLQIAQGASYSAQSEKNSLAKETLFAPRGIITDKNGEPLATNGTNDDGSVTRTYVTPGFAHVLGYVSYPKKDTHGNYYDTSLDGIAGVEAAQNTVLSGENGSLLVEKDALGKVASQGSIIEPHPGENLTLTIDAKVQKAFYDSISSLADKIPFVGGVGILMDVETGAVRALVSYPEYDPNVLTSGTPNSVIASYNTSSRKPYLDRAVTGLYTPGSVVKPLEAAGALTDHTISPDYTINDTGSISVPNPYDPEHPSIFKDWKAIGLEDMRRAIAFSSDVYFYTVGGGYGSQKGLGIERLAYWYRTFGLASSTGIQVPREEDGFIPTPAWKEKALGEAWRIGDTYHTAIGQYAMQVTPIEMARAIGAIANGGKLVTPTLVENTPVSATTLPLDPAALKVVQEGMRQGVLEGTSIGLSFPFVHVAGKTGTAQTGVHNEYYNSWAVGFFPYEHPKYVYTVVMERGPAGNATGAVYVMSQVLQALHETAPEYFE